MISYSPYLEHHGIKGMKWGVRRFQNPDGSYTAEGKARYGIYGGVNKPIKDRTNYSAWPKTSKTRFSPSEDNLKKNRSKQIKKQRSKRMTQMNKRRAKEAAERNPYQTNGKQSLNQYFREQKDKQRYGKKGTKRIQERVNNGVSYTKARRPEAIRSAALFTAAYAGVMLAADQYFTGGAGRKILASTIKKAGKIYR